MSRYIEFATSAENPHYRFSKGIPVHDEKLPSRFLGLKGIRIDGKDPLIFQDASIEENLHRTPFEIKRFQAKGAVIDCLAFVALMSGLCLGQSQTDGRFIFEDTTLPVNINSDDLTNSYPLNLGIDFIYEHSVYPAHHNDAAAYLQKLGDIGPVCLSTLDAAKEMYGLESAHQMTNLVIRS